MRGEGQVSGGKTAVQSRGAPLSFVKFKKEDIEQSIPARFEQQVARHPDRMAVKTKRYELSYATLNRATNRLGRAILAQRGNREEPVALLLETDAPLIAAIVGTFKAGKILLPLDPSFPHERLAHLFRDSGAPVIVTNDANLSLAKGLAGDARKLINIDAVPESLSPENLDLSLSPAAPAWLLYTSSSAGEAKGVVRSHRNFLHGILRFTNSLRLSPDDRVVLLSSYSQSTGLTDIFRALLNGAALFPFDIREEGLARLPEFLIRHEITICHFAPSVFRSFVETLHGDEEFPAIRLVHLGGEPVSRRDVETYKKHFSKNCILLNNLGATETGSYRQYFIDHQTEISGNLVPVGYAVDDVDVVLLDEFGEEVPFNHVGEITVKSRYLAEGYWGRPDLTQAAYLPDPKGGDQRIYLTGDLGRMLPDGCLEYLGRKDFRVKIRGYSIEVAEIEMALLDLTAVKDAVVVAREDRPNDQRLVAYLVPNSQSTLTVTTLRRAVADRLPDYMIPSTFVFLDALPLGPNGKVDRRALPAPDRARPRLEGPFVAPGTPLEQELAAIWAEVLGLDQVGIHDNFLDLGGHSLLAAQILSRVISRFGVELPAQSLFEAPTVAEMAVVVTQSQAKNAGREEMARMLHVLEGFSDEDARRLLVDEMRQTRGNSTEPDSGTG